MGKELYGLRLLVVDDDVDTRELIDWVLRRAGAEVVCAGSVREALDALEKERFHLLISDIAMPDEDGYSLIRKVRALEGTTPWPLPAVALTAYAREEDRQLSRPFLGVGEAVGHRRIAHEGAAEHLGGLGELIAAEWPRKRG